MPIVLVHEGVTQEQYEETVRKLTGGKGPVESPADWPVEGLLVHITGQGPNGFRIVDVWESEDAVWQFGETLIPVLKEVGIQTEPEMYPVHTYVSA